MPKKLDITSWSARVRDPPYMTGGRRVTVIAILKDHPFIPAKKVKFAHTPSFELVPCTPCNPWT